MKNEVEKYNNR